MNYRPRLNARRASSTNYRRGFYKVGNVTYYNDLDLYTGEIIRRGEVIVEEEDTQTNITQSFAEADTSNSSVSNSKTEIISQPETHISESESEESPAEQQNGRLYWRLPDIDKKFDNQTTLEDLGKNVKRTFQKYKDLFPQFQNTTNFEKIAENFCREFFAETAIAQPINLANISLKDNSQKNVVLAIRFPYHPRFQPLWEAHNITVGVSGFCPTGLDDPIFIPEKVYLTHNDDTLEFERGVNVIFEERTLYNQRTTTVTKFHNCLKPSFVRSLPKYGVKTRENLELWFEFLRFKENLINYKTRGVRYIHRRYNRDNDTLEFVIVTSSKAELKEILFAFSRQSLSAFEADVSEDNIEFKIKQIDDNRSGRNFRASDRDFGSIAAKPIRNLNEKELSALKEEFKEELQEFENRKKYISILTLDASEELIKRIQLFAEDPNVSSIRMISEAEDEDSEQTVDEKIEALIKKIPKNGFLAVSMAGDLVQIARHREAVSNLMQGKNCYAPYLSNYLFDISSARLPTQIPKLDTVFNENLNELQQKAVEKILATQDLTLIQGPPGTGKTTVIAEAILQFARRGEKVLLSSQSHDALDNALSRLQTHPDLNSIRLGNSSRITESGKEFTEDNALKKHYSSLKDHIEGQYLDPVKTLETQIAENSVLLKRAKFIEVDVSEAENRLKETTKKIQLAQNQEAKANQEFQRELEAHKASQKQQEFVGQVSLLLQDNSQVGDIAGDFPLDTAFAKTVELITNLQQSLKLESAYSFAEYSSSRKQGFLFGYFYRQWLELVSHLAEMKYDLSKVHMAANAKEGDLDVDTKIEVDRLKAREEDLAEQLDRVDDPVLKEEWRSVRKQIKDLKAKSSEVGKNLGSYLSLFLEQNKVIDFTPEQKTNWLKKVILEIERTRESIASNNENLLTSLKQLSEAVVAEPSPHALLEASRNLEEYKQERAEQEEHLARKQEQVKLLVEDLTEKVEADIHRIVQVLQSTVDQATASLTALNQQHQEYSTLYKKWNSILGDIDQRAKKDWSRLKEPFFESCNLVAVTCNENTKVLTDNGFDSFDVVIIDEVSKATPVELLLPLMRAKKAVLVGDHRQLPPVFNEAEGFTFEEEIEDLDNEEELADAKAREARRLELGLTKENFDKFENLVTASLFKQLFEDANSDLKSRLEVQYRMHPDIMKMINVFYEGRLDCGNPTKDRKHNIELPNILDKDDHVLWIDTSNDADGNPYEVDGRKNVNEMEAKLIAQTLLKLNEKIKNSEEFKATKQKVEVGVVSFYQPQLRKIREEIRNFNKDSLRFEAIEVEINTVIRYQGKEKPIILISMVKNNGKSRNQRFDKNSKANVARYEFINVAISRAQNLLFIFGARNMFENREIKIPNMDQPGFEYKKAYLTMFNDLESPNFKGRVIDNLRYSRLFSDSTNEFVSFKKRA